MRGKILIPQHFQEEVDSSLRENGLEPVPYDANGRILSDSDGTVALFRWWVSGDTGDRMIEDHPQLRWIHTGSAGVDHILTPTFSTRQILLTNSAGVHAPSIAEWVVACILSVEKGLPVMLEQQKLRVWESVERDEISSRTLLFLGAGEIARAIAHRMKAFSPRMIAIRRTPEPSPLFDEVLSTSSVDDVIGIADWTILTIPLTLQTRGLMDAARLARTKRGSRIVNVSRGEIVDEGALVHQLNSGATGGAVLDVFSEEPLPTQHPLWSAKNVIILPHTSWRSPQVRQRQVALFLDNARRFARGETLSNVVDPAAGY